MFGRAPEAAARSLEETLQRLNKIMGALKAKQETLIGGTPVGVKCSFRPEYMCRVFS
jgi:hypothetical protein